MNEISRTSERTLGRAVPSQRTDRSLKNSELTSRAIVPAGPTPGETTLRSRVVDIRKNLAVRNFFLQVTAEHELKPGRSGNRHLIVGDSLVRDLNEIFLSGQTTVLSYGGASVAQVIKMMETQNEDQVDTLIVMLGTNDISRAPVTPESKWEPLVVCLLNEQKENCRQRLVVLCTNPRNPEAGTPMADFMNSNMTRWNEMVRNLNRSNPGELRLMDLENTLRMTDHLAHTRDGIHFNTLQGRRWINDAFQTRVEEMEGELRTTDALARTSLTGRVRSNVPEQLANRLGPLTSEASVTDPAVPISDVRERLGTVSPPRRQSVESRLGRPNEMTSQASTNVSNLPTIAPAPAGNSSATATKAERIEPTSVLLWNRPDPCAWGQYKTDMLATLNMNTLTSRVDARRMMDASGPTVSGLYRISGVDWLLAEQGQFSSATTLRFVDLDGLPQDNTMGPLTTRSLTDVRRRARELVPPLRSGKFTTENRPNNEHHKMYRQFTKPPG